METLILPPDSVSRLSLFPSALPLIDGLCDLWRVPERLPLADWSEKNFYLSSEYSARTGPIHLYGWQREIFNAFTDPMVEEVVVMSGVQMVKSILIGAAIAYVVVEDPGPILLLEPKEEAATAFSKRRLSPMIRDCPGLKDRMSASLHSGKATLLSKDFPGGNLLIVSANTPIDVAQHTIRYVFCDEPDKYSSSAGKEGDPMDLAWERATTFGSRRKRIIACSPTVMGHSRIDKAYADSDRRRPYVPCPRCSYFQVLDFSQVKGADGGSFVPSRGQNVRYECSNLDCRYLWNDVERKAACEKAVWRAERPFSGVAGFWISHLYSPWKDLRHICRHFLKVKDDPPRLQVFINTVLAKVWQQEGSAPDSEVLHGRREMYPHTEEAVVPMRGLFLTAAVDVQESPPRLEVEVKAWGRGRENWSVGYWVLQAFAENGQPYPVTSRELWDQLDVLLQRNFRHESGHYLPILVMAIDTGQRPKPVYEFARRHAQLAYGPTGIRLHAIRTVVPVKGNDDALRIISAVSKEDASRKRQGTRIVTIGTHCAKQEIFDLLQHCRPKANGTMSGAPVVGCYHFPNYELTYFEGLASEVKVVKDNGKVEYEKRNPRNEPLDLAVYGRGAAAIVGIDRFTEVQWRQFEQALGIQVGKGEEGQGETDGENAVAASSASAMAPPEVSPEVPPPPPVPPPAVQRPQAAPPVRQPVYVGQMRRGVRGGFL